MHRINNHRQFGKSAKKKRKELSITDKSMPYFEEPSITIENGKTILKYACKLCPKNNPPINGTKASNLSSHLGKKHPDIYVIIAKRNDKETLPIKRVRILQNAVEIVSVNGRPFNYLLDSGYQAGIKNKLKKLDDAGMGINFSNKNLYEVKDRLSEMAEKVRNKIRNELKGKIVSLMVDIGTKNRRSILGIGIQYVFDGKLRVRSLGMIELKESHTGTYLADMIMDRLKTYNIEKRQVLTITTDNGKNVLKMIREIDSNFPNLNENPTTELFNNVKIALVNKFNEPNEIGVDEKIEQIMDEDCEITEEEALDIWANCALGEDGRLLASISSHLIFENDTIYEITGVNCSAHTLQLVVKDGLNLIDKCHSNVIKLVRKITKFLKLSSTRHVLKEEGITYSTPRIDCTTRWGSTYLMVRKYSIECFFQFLLIFRVMRKIFNFFYLYFSHSFGFQLMDVLKCKHIIEHFAEKRVEIFQLLLKKWSILKEIVHILGIPYRATISLQKKDLTLSDAFGIWLIAKLHLIQATKQTYYKTKLAAHLLDALEKRKTAIFNNPFMCAALFLDPRFRKELMKDSVKFEEAMKLIADVWHRIESSTEPSLNKSSTANPSDISFEFDENTALQNYIEGNLNNSNEMQTTDIELLLEKFDPEPLNSNETVLQYWERMKDRHSILYKLANVIFAIPPTEVQIERDFSSLNFVFTDRRCSLTEERLEDIMILHINPDLFYLVKSEELAEATEKYDGWKQTIPLISSPQKVN